MTATAHAHAPAHEKTKEAESGGGFESAKFTLLSAPMDKIRLGKYSLRDVDRNSVDYQQLRDSIGATNGPMMAIFLREIPDPINPGDTAYGLIDGLQRYSCCLDLGFKHIPARLVSMEDAQVAAAQIIANRSRIDTKPAEYTQQLKRMLVSNPTMTLGELADQLHCSETWLKTRLSLANLHPKISPMVDAGTVPLTHAYQLAKLKPADEQLAFLEQAQTQSIQEFSGHVTNRLKALRDAARAGRDPNKVAEFVPVPHMRAVKEIKEAYTTPVVAPEILNKMGAKTAIDGFKAALSWVLNMDPISVERLRIIDEDRKKADMEARKERSAERARKAMERARELAAKAGIPDNGAVNGTTVIEEDDEEDEE